MNLLWLTQPVRWDLILSYLTGITSWNLSRLVRCTLPEMGVTLLRWTESMSYLQFWGLWLEFLHQAQITFWVGRFNLMTSNNIIGHNLRLKLRILLSVRWTCSMVWHMIFDGIDLSVLHFSLFLLCLYFLIDNKLI